MFQNEKYLEKIDRYYETIQFICDKNLCKEEMTDADICAAHHICNMALKLKKCTDEPLIDAFSQISVFSLVEIEKLLYEMQKIALEKISLLEKERKIGNVFINHRGNPQIFLK
jgi:hypothetical protein